MVILTIDYYWLGEILITQRLQELPELAQPAASTWQVATKNLQKTLGFRDEWGNFSNKQRGDFEWNLLVPKRREFSRMIHWLTINFFIPATPQQPIHSLRKTHQ